MPLGEYLNKPEYAYRPGQMARRLRRAWFPGGSRAVVGLPWRLELRVRPDDDIGRAIWTTGIYDLAVSEVLWRLIEPGEAVVDGGANIGHMTSLMAFRAGARGAVRAFEPHHGVFEELEANVRGWAGTPSLARIELHEEALSDQAGTGRLVEGPAFARNRGTAHLAADGGAPVRLTTLDAQFPATDIGVIKLDLEGHEAAALRGAGRMLASARVRDIVYEAANPASDEVARLLAARGYTVLGIGKAFRGPLLSPQAGHPSGRWMPPSLLATRDPGRAVARLRPRGWRCLRGR